MTMPNSRGEEEGPWRVMVVGVQRMIAERVRILSHTYTDFVLVAEVEVGRAALTDVVRLSPDVVLVGEHLPDAGGLQVCSRLHRMFAELALIFVAERITDSLRLLAVEAGAC